MTDDRVSDWRDVFVEQMFRDHLAELPTNCATWQREVLRHVFEKEINYRNSGGSLALRSWEPHLCRVLTYVFRAPEAHANVADALYAASSPLRLPVFYEIALDVTFPHWCESLLTCAVGEHNLSSREFWDGFAQFDLEDAIHAIHNMPDDMLGRNPRERRRALELELIYGRPVVVLP